MDHHVDNPDPPNGSDENDSLLKWQQRQLDILKSKLNINYEIPKNNPVDYIFIVLHGIGVNDSVIESEYKTLKYTLESVRRHWFYRQQIKTHLHAINWKKYIVDAQNTLFENVCIDTVKGTRRMIALAMLDICFYFNPKFADFLLVNVANDINSEITRLRTHTSGIFKNSKIVLIGYSMGSVIADELLRGNTDRLTNLNPSERPKLEHKVDYFFALGSPLSCALVYQTPRFLNTGLQFPEGVRYLNVFHPYDPIACRWERLIYRDVDKIPDPVILPFWRNNGFKNWYDWDKRMQHAKSVIVDNITDVATSISKSIFGWWGNSENNSVLNKNITSNDNRKRAFDNFRTRLKNQNTLETLEVFDDPISSIANGILTERNKDNSGTKKDISNMSFAESEEIFSDIEDIRTSEKVLEELNKSNPSLPVRYDFQLQEDATEHYLNPLAILQSHISYWGSRDLSFFILKTVHGSYEKMPITALLLAIESKAKKLSLVAENKTLKHQFAALAEDAKKALENISKEDLMLKTEGTVTLKTAWNAITRANDVEIYPNELSTCDIIETDGIFSTQ